MLSTLLKCTSGALSYEIDIQRFSSTGLTYNYSNLGGVVPSDVVYFFMATASGGFIDPSTPSGYTSIAVSELELSNRLVYREIDGSEGSSVTLSGTSTGVKMSVVAIKVSNQEGFTNGVSSSNNSSSLSVAGVTATEGLLFLLGTARDRDSPYTLEFNGTQADGMTLLEKQDTDGTADSMLGVVYVENITAGSTGTRTLSLINAGGTDTLAGVILNIY